MQNILEDFWVFRTLLNDLHQIIVDLNTLTDPLTQTVLVLQMEIDFDWTGPCNLAFRKLKFCMNSDTCHNSFG